MDIVRRLEMLQGKYAEDAFAKYACSDARVKEALKKVPRHCFAPSRYSLEEIYSDVPLRIQSVSAEASPGAQQEIQMLSTLSQSSLVAYMIDRLNIQKGDKILEIGTSSGYTAALAAHLNQVPEKVFTVEFQPELAPFARENFEKAGFPDIRTLTGDGFYGWRENAPYDVIMTSVGMPAFPRELLLQLKEGGTFAAPIAFNESEPLCAYFVGKILDGKLVGGVWDQHTYFMSLQGEHSLERPFPPLDRERVKTNLKGRVPEDFHLFETLKQQLGFLLFLGLKKKRIVSERIELAYPGKAPVAEEFHGWAEDADHLFLASKGKMITAGSPDFRAELDQLTAMWVQMGFPDMSQFRLVLDLRTENEYEGWRLWDLKGSVSSD